LRSSKEMHVIWLLKGEYNLPLLFTDVVNFQFRYETSTSLFARRIPSDLSARNNILQMEVQRIPKLLQNKKRHLPGTTMVNMELALHKMPVFFYFLFLAGF